jgi:hypothetical protein
MAMLYLCQKDFFKNCMMVSALEHNTIVILMVIEAFVNEEMQASENMPIDSWRATICLWGMIDGSSSSRRGKITAACISPSMISKDRWLRCQSMASPCRDLLHPLTPLYTLRGREGVRKERKGPGEDLVGGSRSKGIIIRILVPALEHVLPPIFRLLCQVHDEIEYFSVAPGDHAL